MAQLYEKTAPSPPIFPGLLDARELLAGCDHCYAEHLVGGRMGYSGDLAVWGPAPHTPLGRDVQRR